VFVSNHNHLFKSFYFLIENKRMLKDLFNLYIQLLGTLYRVWVLTINFVDLKICNNNGGPDYFKALSFNKNKEC